MVMLMDGWRHANVNSLYMQREFVAIDPRAFVLNENYLILWKMEKQSHKSFLYFDQQQIPNFFLA